MEIQGKIIQKLDLKTGTSKAGTPWQKQEWVLETFDRFPKKIKVQTFGDRVNNIHMEPGKDYIVSVDIESREYNGNWYTDVSVYAAREMDGAQNAGGYNAPQAPMGQPVQNTAPAGDPFASSDDSDDLPF